MAITRSQIAKQLLEQGGRVGLRFGSEGYQGGRTDQGGAGRGTGPERGGGNNGNRFTEFTKENLNPQVDTVTEKFTGRSNLFGGANRFGYTELRPDGSLKPGYGGRIFGGLLSLLTGVPFIGSAIGSMYDKGTGLFDRTKGFFNKGPNYNDMSEFNRLGLFGLPKGTLDEEDKIASPLSEAELNAYSRFGDIGLPNPNKVSNITGTNYPGSNQNLMTTGVQEGPYSNMTDYLETNTGGITATEQFDNSPYGRISDDMVP